MLRTRLPLGLVLAIGVLAAFASVARAGVVLHEYFRPDPADDLRLSATTSDGQMSAVIQTQSGPLSVPAASAEAPGAAVYGGDGAHAEDGAVARLDSDTTQPSVVRYEDPFTPEIMPFKRDTALDLVTADYELIVADRTLEEVGVHGTVGSDEDPFYADLVVDVVEGVPVRVPTVGPGTRILGLRTQPPTTVRVMRDGADNFFLEGIETQRVRVVMHLAIDRATFGSAFDSVSWSRLAAFVPLLPPEVKERATRVAERIGVGTTLNPARALEALVSHFRGFAPSAERPASVGGELYEELALTKKGVCRHRAFAFTVTALGLGLPTRFVHNEAHAWVEVFDASVWHRIDLGGAAGRVESELGGRPPHVTPRDPFSWPPGSESGAGMAERARQAQPFDAARRGSTSGGDAIPSPDDPRAALPEGEPHQGSILTLSVGSQEALRGDRLSLAGEVKTEEGPCPRVRVDFELTTTETSSRAAPIHLGTLFTDPEGRYEHRIVIPHGIPVGDYVVVARTPGGGECGPGQSR
jgi:hypothetical protein